MGVMSDALIVGIVSAVVSLIGIFVASKTTRDEVAQKLDKNQAVMETKLDALQKKVDEHNGYAKLFNENVPVIKEQIKVANHRIEDLEHEMRDLCRGNNSAS